MLDIKLQSFDEMNCLEQIIATYAIACNRKYEMMFASSWGFELLDNENLKIGERISSNSKIQLEYLKLYHGIEVMKGIAVDNTQLIDVIGQNIKNNLPVIIFLSNFYYPWNEHYHKFNNGLPHAILVVDISYKYQKLYCLDSKFNQERGEICFQDIIDGCTGEYWVLKTLEHYSSEIQTQEILTNTISMLSRNKENSSSLENINEIYIFSDLMKSKFNYQNEIDGKHGGIWIEPIIFNISNIIQGRANYNRMLDYIINKHISTSLNSILIQVKFKMEEIILQWKQVRGLIIKGKYIDEIDDLLYRIARRIKKIADFEMEAAQLLIPTNTCPNDNNLNIKPDFTLNTISNPLTDIYFIPLEHLYNYQCFGNQNDSNSYIHIGGMCYFFHLNQALEKELWKNNYCKFYRPIITGYDNDCISCRGQIINIKQESYKAIMFMVHGDLCTYEEEIIINYIDGINETVLLKIPDPFDFSKIIWSGQCGYVTDVFDTWTVNIYAILYKIQRNKIKSIVLPNCPNLILFAISLGK